MKIGLPLLEVSLCRILCGVWRRVIQRCLHFGTYPSVVCRIGSGIERESVAFRNLGEQDADCLSERQTLPR